MLQVISDVTTTTPVTMFPCFCFQFLPNYPYNTDPIMTLILIESFALALYRFSNII